MDYYDGKKVTIKNGYYIIWDQSSKYSYDDGTVYVHMLVADKKYGNIPEGYTVHHIDRNRLNNDPSNLMILPMSDHTTLHEYMKKYPEVYDERDENKLLEVVEYVKINGMYDKETEFDKWLDWYRDNIYRKIKLEKSKENPDDNLLDSYYEELKKYDTRPKSKCPDKETLLKELSALMNVESVGRIYDVNGNSVRKWCKNLGIDPKQYSSRANDEYVENICPYCGKVVRSTKKDNKKFCNIDCYNSYYKLDETKIIELFNSGLSIRKISSQVKSDRKTISNFLKRKGLM